MIPRSAIRSARFGLLLACGLAAALVDPSNTSATPPPPSSSPRMLQPRPGVVEQWAQVLTVSKNWLVIENEDGQQFPVSISNDTVGLFLVRWPTSLDRIAPSALLEATGMDTASNTVLTDHVDVYDGAAQFMVEPGMLSIGGAGRVFAPIDFTFNADAYGAPFPGFDAPIQSGFATGAAQLHIVGPMVNRFPLRIGIFGTNNFVTVVPPPQGVTMSQITQGNIGFIRPGDLVYIAAVETRPKSLVLEQLIVYKTIPLDRFQQ